MTRGKLSVRAALCGPAACALIFLTALLISDGKILSSVPNRYFQGQGSTVFSPAFRPYGLIVGAALLIALCVFVIAEKGREKAFVFAALAPALGLLLSRLVYVLVNGSFYFRYAGVVAALRADEGGMSLTGALFGALLAEKWIYGRETRPLGSLAVSMAAFVPFVRLAEHFSGNGLGLGREVEAEEEGLFAAMGDWSCLLRVYLIEAIVAFLILTAVLTALLKLRPAGEDRKVFFLFVVLLGITQVMMESLRGDHHMEWGFVKVQMFLYFLPAAGVIVAVSPGKKARILSAVLTCVFAGTVFFLEKARDRGWIPGEEGVYTVFMAVTVLYLTYALYRLFGKKEKEA